MARDVPDEQLARERAFREAVAANIVRLRKERGINQDELADLANLHRAHLGFIEQLRNEPSLTTLMRVAWALGVSVRELVDVEDRGEEAN